MSAPQSGQEPIVVVGGGIAGALCALSLGRAGVRVVLCEAAPRLGGKAGAAPVGAGHSFPAAVEHGPHFVAGWYLNMLALLRELGLDRRLVHYPGFHLLMPSQGQGRAGRAVPLAMTRETLTAAARQALGRADAFGVRWPDAVRAAALGLDVLRAAGGDELDDVSVAAFAQSRWYGDDELATLAHNQVLRGSSIPAQLASMRTMRQLMAMWFRHSRPFVSVFDGDLDAALIAPLTRALAEVVEVRTATPVSGLLIEEGAVAGVRLADGHELRAGCTVSAVPLEVLRGWVGDELEALDARLMGVHRLQATPMGAVQFAFKRRVRGIPPGVSYLWGSQPPVNVLELTDVWRDVSWPGSLVTVLLGDYDAMRGLSDERRWSIVLAQMRRFLPDATPDALAHVVFRENDDAPLFLNVVGTWRHRPLPMEPYAGGRLFVTGDFAQNAVDLTTMEGAALAGLKTAQAIAQRLGRAPAIAPLEPHVDGRIRRAGYAAGRLALTPALLAASAARLRAGPLAEVSEA